MPQFSTRVVPGDNDLVEEVTEVLRDEECVAFIQHTHDDRFLLFMPSDPSPSLLEDFSDFHLAFVVAKILFA